jgi:galactonate dehydratase
MKITRIETIRLGDTPNLLFVGVHTDQGLVGWADTFYMADAVRGFVHEFAAPMLLGHDPLAIELHWRRLYEVITHTRSPSSPGGAPVGREALRT